MTNRSITSWLVRSSEFGVRSLKIYLRTSHFALRTVLLVWILLGIWDLGFGISPAHAKEIVILYTGETHAMLYTCSCPKEPDGGVARRGTLVKKLRAENSDTLLLDAGGFFAGGLLDEFTQSTQLDMQRTSVNVDAMERMGYEAAVIGNDELNFGLDFLKKLSQKSSFHFLSCNISSGQNKPEDDLRGADGQDNGFKPYVIKDIAGIKIGVIGVTSLSAAQKAAELRLADPKTAVAEAVEDLKKKGANIIVLLSQLEESEDLSILSDIKGIDILIGGRHPAKDQPYVKLENTLVLKPFWQGRSLGKATLTLEEGKIAAYKVEGFRLSDKITDDPDILSVLPRCFSDVNCKRENLVGKCKDPGTPKASCLFSQPNKVGLTVITSKACTTCNTDQVVNLLKKSFPGLSPSTLYYSDKTASEMVKRFDISGLPAYLLGREAEKEPGFNALKQNLELMEDFYVVKPQWSGTSYFFNRDKIKGRLDLFLSLYDKNSKGILDVIKEFAPRVHFLAVEEQGKLDAAKGEPEVEEYLRAVCLQKYYPDAFWDYISCRAQDIGSSWWDECAKDLDTRKIKSCAIGEEGKLLLKENIMLNKELRVLFGPAYLVDNQEVFASNGVPAKEELRAAIKR